MRRALVPLVLAGFLAAVAPAHAAAVAKRSCASRAEGPGPVTRLASPRAFARFRDPSGRYLVKSPLMVRAGRVVTVSISRRDRPVAGLTFVHDAPRGTGVPAVRFVACDKDEPAFSYNGTVGPVTAFAGGWSLAQPACVRVSARVRGHRFVYARTVSFGMGRAAGNCDKI